MARVRSQLAAIGAVALLLGIVLVGQSPRGSAQDATPGVTEHAAHPAHIHQGSCANLDPNPLYPLADVTADEGESAATPGAVAGMMGAMTAAPVEVSVTTVEVALADLLGGGSATPGAGSGGFAINVHESAQNASRYIACGDIGGAVRPATGGSNGDLIVGLREQNGSGYTGVAWLHDNGNGSSTVTIFLAQGLSGGAAATPMV